MYCWIPKLLLKRRKGIQRIGQPWREEMHQQNTKQKGKNHHLTTEWKNCVFRSLKGIAKKDIFLPTRCQNSSPTPILKRICSSQWNCPQTPPLRHVSPEPTTTFSLKNFDKIKWHNLEIRLFIFTKIETYSGVLKLIHLFHQEANFKVGPSDVC